MVLFKYLLLLIVGVAPIASIGSLIGTFFSLGGWGWILFLWFGFTGMFSMGAAKLFESSEGSNDSGNMFVAVGIALLLIAAFAGGLAFALSDLPHRISVFYVLLAPLIFLPVFMLLKRKPRSTASRSNPLQEFEREIEGWPQEQARTALLLIKATMNGDRDLIDKLYPELTVAQLKAVEGVLRKMEKGADAA